MTPASAKYVSRYTPHPETKLRARSKLGGSMGDDVRPSHRTKNTTRAAPTASGPTTSKEVHGWLDDSMRPKVMPRSPERDGAHADDVEGAAFGVAGFGDGHERDDEPGDRERHVDPEDRGPAEDGQEGSPDHRSEPEAETRDGSPHAEGARPALDRVGLGQDGQRQGGHERTTRTLQRPGADERQVGGGEGARHGAQR